MNNGIIFVIGNGESRRSIDLEKLRNKGTIIGCNALYRDFHPDYLVSVDDLMINEIKASNYEGDLITVSTNKRDNKRYVSDKSGVIADYDKEISGWSSGGVALSYSSDKLQGNMIYLLGFDFDPLKKITKYNNMYKGTNNYRDPNGVPQYTGGFLIQATEVFKKYPYSTFIWVNNNPDDLWKMRNVYVMDIKKFQKQYDCRLIKRRNSNVKK